MRRMKPEPLETYPITEYQNVGDGIDLIIRGPLADKLKDSPHALILRMCGQLGGIKDHAGAIELKMNPGKVISGNAEKYSYFGTMDTGEQTILIVYAYVYKSQNENMLTITLNWNNQIAELVNYFEDRVQYYIGLGYNLGDLINISIEPVSESYLTISPVV